MSIAMTYQVTLETPALFSALEGDPNSAVSHDYIPGSVLRGMAVGAWIRDHPNEVLDPTQEEVKALFFSGAVRWLNAYPNYDGKRSLPAPLTWLRPKYGDRSKVYVQPYDQLPENTKPKTLKSFVRPNGDRVRLIDPEHILKIHVQRERKLGRAVKDGGAVYRYDALASGQIFIGVVLCDTSENAKTLSDLLKNHSHAALGGARTAGYGRVKLSRIQVDEHWQEAVVHDSAQDLHITLLSDVLLRNSYGQPCADAQTLVETLNRHLNTKLSLGRAFTDTLVVGGFNRKWGLPLPQALALKMGSVLILSGEVDPVRLSQIADSGIGERRAEGFGRLAFNWLSDIEMLEIQNDTDSVTPKPKVITNPPPSARPAMRRLMFQNLERAAVTQSIKVTEQIKKIGIKRSQLNRLRAEVRKKLAAPTPSADFREFFKGLKETARKQFERQKIGDKRGVSTWIESLDMDGELGSVKTKYQPVWENADVSRAKLMLIDAVLARVAKLSKEADGE